MGVCIGEVDVKANGLHTVDVPKRVFFVKQEQTFIDLINGKECKYAPHVEDGVKLQGRSRRNLQIGRRRKKWVEL
ncbi:MAG: hypothetical protein L6V93_07210 [Clostridiales bacterium]|nr:MAG: hypothetical protein L6V93_07210 [Clostridiales bacterium]